MRPPTAAQLKWINLASRCNALSTVTAIHNKILDGIKPTGHKSNPAYLGAHYEISFIDSRGRSIPDPFPFRYDSQEAAAKHISTGRVQPEHISPVLTTWSDGTETPALYDPEDP